MLLAHPFLRSLSLAGAFAMIQAAHSATVTGVSAVESGGALLPYVAGNGGLNEESLVLFQNASAEISASWSRSDPEAAAAYVASLPDGTRGEIVNISLGATISDPALLSSALQMAMERWLALSTSGNSERIEFLDGDRGGRRGDESSEREFLLSWLNSDPSFAADPAFGSGSLGSVPEPSVSLLGALGALGLLRRRR